MLRSETVYIIKIESNVANAVSVNVDMNPDRIAGPGIRPRGAQDIAEALKGAGHVHGRRGCVRWIQLACAPALLHDATEAAAHVMADRNMIASTVCFGGKDLHTTLFIGSTQVAPELPRAVLPVQYLDRP